MENKDIHDYLKEKYSCEYNDKLTKVILIDVSKDVSFYIGKILFSDSNIFGIRILETGDTFLFNFKKNKTYNNSFKNIIVIYPDLQDYKKEYSFNENIIISCEIIIKKMIDDINDMIPSIKINKLYKM